MIHRLKRVCALLLALCLLPLSLPAQAEDSLADIDMNLDLDWTPDWDADDEVPLTDDGYVWTEDDFTLTEDTAAELDELDNLERDESVNPDDLELNLYLPGDVINILLIGIDSHDPDINEDKTSHLNDANIILSINRRDGSIKMTSLLRDLYVEMPGYVSKGKLNNAFARGSRSGGLSGGAQLTMRTINHCFELNLENYVIINFFGLASIIDALGGIDIDLTAREAGAINTYLNKVAYTSSAFTYDTKNREERQELERVDGWQHCDGIQALIYARLREIDNDFRRTERQRHLLELLLKQALEDINLEKILSLLQTCLPYVSTNLSASELVDLALLVLRSGLLERAHDGGELMQQHRVPEDRSYSYLELETGGTVINMGPQNWNKAIRSIHTFIYGDYYPAKGLD